MWGTNFLMKLLQKLPTSYSRLTLNENHIKTSLVHLHSFLIICSFKNDREDAGKEGSKIGSSIQPDSARPGFEFQLYSECPS